MANSTRMLVDTMGIGLELIAGISELIPDLQHLDMSAGYNDTVNIGLEEFKENDQVLVITADDANLIDVRFALAEAVNFDTKKLPMREISVGQYSELFNAKGETVLVARVSDREFIEKVLKEYFRDRDMDDREERGHGDTEEEEPSEEKKEETSEEEEDSWNDEDDFDDSPEDKKKNRKKNKENRYSTSHATVYASSAATGSSEARTAGESSGNHQSSNVRAEREYRRTYENAGYTADSSYGHPVEIDAKAHNENEYSPEMCAYESQDTRSEDGGSRRQAHEETRDENRIESRTEKNERHSAGDHHAIETGYTPFGGERNGDTGSSDHQRSEEAKEERTASRHASQTQETGGQSEKQHRGNERSSEQSVRIYSHNISRYSHIGNPNITDNNGTATEIFSNGTSRTVNDTSLNTRSYNAGVERAYTSTSVINNLHFQKSAALAMRTVGSAMIPTGSEGGRQVQTIAMVGLPVGKYLIDRAQQLNAYKLNNTINFNGDIYASALVNGAHMKPKKAIEKTENLINEIGSGTNGILSNLNIADAGKDITMSMVYRYMRHNGQRGLITMVSRMQRDEFLSFLSDCGISDEFYKVIGNMDPKFLLNSSTYRKLLDSAVTDKDLELIRTLNGALLEAKFGNASPRYLIKMLARNVGRNAVHNVEGMQGLNMTLAAKNVVKTVYRSGMKVTSKAAKAMGASDKTLKVMGALSRPVDNALKVAGKVTKNVLTTKIGGTAVAAGTGAGTAAAGTAAGTAAASGAATGATAGATAGAAAGTAAGTAAGGAAAGGAAVGGIAVGWIVLIVAIVLVLFLSVSGQTQLRESQSDYKAPLGGYMYVQDTEIMQEVTDLLEAKNEAFNREINEAAHSRPGMSYNIDFTENELVAFYEEGAYAVFFRDFEGNELVPTTVDLNNTKAILSMATRYIPYPFRKLDDTATDEEKLEYEQMKQYFIDYCSYLWAATHQITIEEYHPGDDRYAEYDESGLSTDIATGKCAMDGETVWLPSDFKPNMCGTQQCDSCGDRPEEGYGKYGDALCTSWLEKNEHDGWRMTGEKEEHINCTGHKIPDYTTDKNGNLVQDGYTTEYCSEDKMYSESHKHICYEWVYECGGHMGSVVYVTIGDLSRIPSMPEAGDVNYDAVGKYPSDEPEGYADSEEE